MNRITNSLQFKLVAWFVVTSLAIWIAAAFWINSIILHSSYSSYDYILSNFVNTLARRVRVENGRVDLDFPTEIIPILRERHIDQRYFEIRASDKTDIHGNAVLPFPDPVSTQVSLSDTTYQGLPIRLAVQRAYIPNTDLYCDIGIAETLDGRLLNARNTTEKFLWWGLIIFGMLLFKAAWVVKRGLAPLERVRKMVAELSISHYSRERLDLSPVPTEIRPLVVAINDMLGRIRDDMDKQMRFISNAAHQLRTPLAGLKLQAELVNRDPSTSKSNPKVEQLQIGIDRACNLVNKMLALATTEPEIFNEASKSKCDLVALAREAVGSIAPQALNKGIDIGLDVKLSNAFINGRSWALKEMFSNLLDNAVRYTPPHGSVTVSIEEHLATLIVAVEDSGPGIPECERERVFERFYRLPDSTGNGSGLGLAIVQEIASQHGATVRIVPCSSGDGTRVELAFSLNQIEMVPIKIECALNPAPC